jgi:hypothetical protein
VALKRVTWQQIPLPDVVTGLEIPLLQEFRRFYPEEGDGMVALDSALLLTTADTTNVVNLKYPASHSLLLRVTGMHQRLIEELKAVG